MAGSGAESLKLQAVDRCISNKRFNYPVGRGYYVPNMSQLAERSGVRHTLLLLKSLMLLCIALCSRKRRYCVIFPLLLYNTETLNHYGVH